MTESDMTHVQNNSMKVKFRCELDGIYILRCIIVLNCVYSDVILKLSCDNNSSVIKMNKSFIIALMTGALIIHLN